MKKYASLLAVFVLLLGLSSLAYAVPAEIPADTTAVIAKGKTQITIGGDLRFRGWYVKNPNVTDENAYYTPGRAAGWYPAQLPSGTLLLVTAGGYEYRIDPRNSRIYRAPTGTTNYEVYQAAVPAKEGSPNTAYYDYRVRLWLEAKISPNTTGFIELEGASGLTSDSADWGSVLGGGRGVYDIGNTKEATVHVRQAWIQYQGTGLLGVPAGVKVGRQLIKLGYGLFYDHTYFGDDAILAFVQPMKELTLAAYHIKFSEGARNLNDDATAYGILAAYAGKGFGLSADITYVDHQNSVLGGDIHLWNFGLRGNVDDIAGTGLNFKADVEFQTGKLADVPGTDPKFKGWAAMAGLDYKFKTIPLSLTLEYAIGSGDKDDTDDLELFVTSVGQEQHYTFIYEYLSPAACEGLVYGRNRTGICNTQYVKFGGAYDITKDLKAELYFYWLRAHRAVSINGYKPSKDLGYEVDAKLTYKIDKGLTYWIDAAYFWPGDAYKMPTGKDADDAWALRHGFQLKF